VIVEEATSFTLFGRVETMEQMCLDSAGRASQTSSFVKHDAVRIALPLI